MSKAESLRFLDLCLGDPSALARYQGMPLPDLVFAARCDGFDMQADDLKSLIGPMEVQMITVSQGEQIDASSSLWRRMWGRSRLDYVVNELYAPLTADERARLDG